MLMGPRKHGGDPGKSKWAKFFVSLVKEPAVIARDFDFDNNINVGLIIFMKK